MTGARKLQWAAVQSIGNSTFVTASLMLRLTLTHCPQARARTAERTMQLLLAPPPPPAAPVTLMVVQAPPPMPPRCRQRARRGLTTLALSLLWILRNGAPPTNPFTAHVVSDVIRSGLYHSVTHTTHAHTPANTMDSRARARNLDHLATLRQLSLC